MSGTSKAAVSLCVLLLAALVVYYGMTPPEESQGQLVDVPKQRPTLFGGDPDEKMVAMGIPPIATELANVRVVVEEVSDQSTSDLPPEPIVVNVEPIVTPVETEVVEQAFQMYVVKDGETLGEIASRELGSYRKWRVIASINDISDPSRVMPGRMLRLPIGQSTPESIVEEVQTPPVNSGVQIHIVQVGETMSSIADDYYGNSNKYTVIVDANPTVDPNRLKIGSKLTVPAL